MSAPLVATCLCRTNSIPLDATLPLTSHLCHCTTCRTSHGALFAMHTDIPALPFPQDSPPPTLRSPSSKMGQIFFCTTCGTWMFAQYFYILEGVKNVGYAVSTGCLHLSDSYKSENPGKKLEDVVSIDFHCLIKDTIDGGAVPWAGDWSKEAQAHFFGNWEEPPMPKVEDAEELAKKHVYPKGRKELDGWCKCKGVKVKITREDENQKFRTIICACDSCRRATGVEFVPYTYVPITQAFFITKSSTGEEEVQNWPETWDDATKEKFKNLIVYESTPGKIIWGACAGCGARVFYHKYGKETIGTQQVEPTTALFGADDKEGIMHLDWFDWKADEGGIGLVEDAEKEGRAGILSRGASERYAKWVEGLKERT